MRFNFKLFSISLILLFISASIFAQNEKKLEGRWDLVISKDKELLPSWLEIRHSGHKTLVGRFVYAFGSARPVSHVKVKDGKFSFAIPPQWEAGENDMEFEGKLVGEKLKGTMKYTDGERYNWTASRAPKLAAVENPVWGAPREIFNQKNLDGWHASGENQWVVENGILTSKKSGSNLITNEKFTDFKLHIEFRYPKDGNSGVYLRGRYEVQVADNKGNEPSDIFFGGLYGFLTPNEMVAKSAGEWQAYDITLIGRRVTVVANGKTIISDQIIPGITGGALDSREGEPGPFMLQGDHGPIEYRNIVVTPLMKK
ncbi:MAG: DUF1080 domain-containing protein [Saprospiraceae bacterium]